MNVASLATLLRLSETSRILKSTVFLESLLYSLHSRARIYDGYINIILKPPTLSDCSIKFILFDPFSFQLAPLFVIIGTGCVGAVAFTIRQATKNPEARYVRGRQL